MVRSKKPAGVLEVGVVVVVEAVRGCGVKVDQRPIGGARLDELFSERGVHGRVRVVGVKALTKRQASSFADCMST